MPPALVAPESRTHHATAARTDGRGGTRNHRRCATGFPGFVDPAPILNAAAKEIGEASVRCITFSRWVWRRGRAGARIGRQHRLAPYRFACKLQANHQLRDAVDHGRIRPQARAESSVVEVWPRLAGRHADSKSLHQTFVIRGIRLAYRWNGRTAGNVSPDDVSRSQLEIWMNPVS